MIITILSNIGISLVLTIALEELLSAILGVRQGKDLVLVLLVNILTNPATVLVYYLLNYYAGWNAILIVICLEMTVILTEYYYYKNYAKAIKAPLFFAIVLNLFSYGIGRLLTTIIV